MQKPFYRQKLPHIQSAGATYFVTYRLAGSIPITVIEQLKEQHEKSLNDLIKNKQYTSNNDYQLQQKYFSEFDSFLGTNLNEPCWLQQTEIAQIAYDSLIYLDGKEINLDCFTIMSNHVHALFSLKDDNDDLYKIMQSHKSFAAKKVMQF